MLAAAVAIHGVYQGQAEDLARRHGLTYPAELERLMLGRLEELHAAGR
jgi:hypothetical protein